MINPKNIIGQCHNTQCFVKGLLLNGKNGKNYKTKSFLDTPNKHNLDKHEISEHIP